MQRTGTAIIGGGASGIAAAISARAAGDEVVILEKTARLAKKVLASGNGRCNLSNERLEPSRYNKAGRVLVRHVFERFGGAEIKAFFSRLGVSFYSDGGRLFPVTNQSGSVVRALELALTRAGVRIQFENDISGIHPSDNGFTLMSRAGERVTARRVIIATGGKSYPSFGSDGSGYTLARALGHTVIEPVPVAVPVVTKDALCQPLQGQKIFASAKALIRGSCEAESNGELLFTKYGLSGTAILDISRPISIALHRDKERDTTVAVDLVPFMKESELCAALENRFHERRAQEDLLVGVLPNKFGAALASRLKNRQADTMAAELKDMRFSITGTRGWNEADFTAGGIPVDEINANTLESLRQPGIYFCGEALDVDGQRGGFNLAWAWASGHIAGRTGRGA